MWLPVIGILKFNHYRKVYLDSSVDLVLHVWCLANRHVNNSCYSLSNQSTCFIILVHFFQGVFSGQRSPDFDQFLYGNLLKMHHWYAASILKFGHWMQKSLGKSLGNFYFAKVLKNCILFWVNKCQYRRQSLCKSDYTNIVLQSLRP